MMDKINNKNTAFTLIELSVVILIIALLMFGTFSSSSGIVNNVKDNITKDRMSVIYNALGNFLLQKKRLPCPASILLPKGDVNYGKEVRNSSTLECNGTGIYSSNSLSSLNLVFGMIPIYDLNLPADFAEDAFGNKISYFIDQRFTYNYISSPDSNLNIPSFGTANYKDIILVKSRNQQNEILVNSDAIITLVSSGANGFGSFKNNGIQNARSSLAEELENDVSNLGSNLESFNKIFYNSFEDEEACDDIVFFKTRNDFVDNFKAMFLIPCKGNDIIDADFNNKTSVYFGQKLEASNSCPLGTESIKKTVKCDVFGRWVKLIPDCPGVNLLKCSVGGTAGMKQKFVYANTYNSDGECEIYYSGNYVWSCDALGNGNVSANNCVSYCDFASTNGMIGRKELPGTTGNGDCASSHSGYYDWECSSSGVGSIINNCTLNP